MFKTTVEIHGMHCPKCEAKVTAAFQKNFETKNVVSDHENNLTEIISEKELDRDLVKKTVDETGFEYVGMKSEVYDKKSVFDIFN